MPSKLIIQYAKNVAIKSKCEHMLAAILYKGGSVIRTAHNELRPIAYRRKYFSHGEATLHAELAVLNNVPRDIIEKCSLLVIRINKNGEMRSAKPCLACAMALNDANIKRVFYSSYSGEILRLDFNELLTNYKKENVDDYI